MEAIGWEKIIALPAAILVLFLILWFALRALPVWKEVKLAEIKVRETEANSRTKEAGAFGQLGAAISQSNIVFQQLAIDNRRDTDKMQIIARVNADATDKILHKLDLFDEIADKLPLFDEIANGHGSICERLEHLERQLMKKES